MRALIRLAYEQQDSIWVFVLVTIVLGGGAAFLAGRAIATIWRPWWHVCVLVILIGAVVRFLHFALFEGPLLSPSAYLIDTAVCLAFGVAGFRLRRVSQMVTSYGWINERANALRWRRRTASASESG